MYAELTEGTESTWMERGTNLALPDEPIETVFFPLDAVASIVGATIGGTVEVATVGREGVVGITTVLGGPPMPNRTFVQVPGMVRPVPAARLAATMEAHPGLRRLMLRYVQALLAQFAQSVACNRLHALEERCARWLLMTHDRVGRDSFALTHEFLAEMLGVRRPSVSIAAKTLQDAGCIRYSRGRVEVLDRHALEQVSCECYAVVRRQYDRLLGPS